MSEKNVVVVKSEELSSRPLVSFSAEDPFCKSSCSDEICRQSGQNEQSQCAEWQISLGSAQAQGVTASTQKTKQVAKRWAHLMSIVSIIIY
jgi:hypothetical protein